MNEFVHSESSSKNPGDPHDAVSPDIWPTAIEHVLQTLTERVPMLERSQIDCILKLQPLSNATIRRTRHKLVQDGWLERYSLLVSTFEEAHAPMFYWKPHDSCPDFERLRETARSQLGAQTTLMRQVYMASRFTANLYGVDYQGAVLTQRCAEWLRWAQVYIRKVVQHGPADHSWEPDGLFEQTGSRDRSNIAAARISGPHSVTSIALLTHCSVRQLHLLHQQCGQTSRSLELW